MPERYELIDRIKFTEREFHVVAQAVERHRRSIQAGDAKLPEGTSPRDLAGAIVQLEPTYLVRIWAEFETALRSYRRRMTGNLNDRMGTENLIEWAAGVKQGRAVSDDVQGDVHEVRKYRNFLVHERDDDDPPAKVAIDVARRRLNTFIQKLPERW